MNYFETITQYNNKFKSHIGNNRSVCSVFALLTAHTFMKNPSAIINEKFYETNLINAVNNFVALGITCNLTSDELLMHTQNNALDTNNVSIFLVDQFHTAKNKVDEYKKMFMSELTNYAVILLKDSNFFTILKQDTKYIFQDCHSSIQYGFDKFDEVINHLKNFYNFETPTLVDNQIVPEFSIINHILIVTPFDTYYNMELKIPKELISQESNNKLKNNKLKNNEYINKLMTDLIGDNLVDENMVNTLRKIFEDGYIQEKNQSNASIPSPKKEIPPIPPKKC